MSQKKQPMVGPSLQLKTFQQQIGLPECFDERLSILLDIILKRLLWFGLLLGFVLGLFWFLFDWLAPNNRFRFDR